MQLSLLYTASRSRLFTIIILVHLLLFGSAAWLDRWPEATGDTRELYPKHSSSLSNLEEAESTFGAGLYDVIVLPNQKGIEFDLEDFETALSQISFITTIISPLEADSSGTSRGFRTRSEDGAWLRYLLRIKPGLSSSVRTTLHKKLNSLVEEFKSLSPLRSGSFFISESLSEAIRKETSRLVPLSAALILVVSIILFRSIRTAIVVLLASLLALLSTALSAGLIGSALGPVSQLAPPFIIVVGSAYSIHVAIQFLRQQKVPDEILHALFLASGTTSIGLLSLLSISTKGITQFAILAATGNFLAMNYALIFVPLLLNVQGEVRTPFAIPAPPRLTRRWLFLGLAISTLLLCSGLLRIHLDTNPVSFLPEGGRSLKQVLSVQSAFPGNRFISLLIRKTQGGSFTDADIRKLAWIASTTAKSENVHSIVSPAKAIIMQQRLKKLEMSEFSLHSEQEFYRGLSNLISSEKDRVRFILEVDCDGQNLLKVIDTLKDELTYKSPSLSFSFSAFEIIMAEQSYAITIGIIESLLYTLGFVFLLLFICTRSLIVSSIGIIPNIIPLLAVFGLIGWIFEEISLGAALVAIAALGIAVDNTFHFILHWRKSHIEGVCDATEETLSELISPFLFTTLILSLGFGVMIVARVLPTYQFGILLSATLWVGLLADITVLPTLLSLIKTPGSKRIN